MSHRLASPAVTNQRHQAAAKPGEAARRAAARKAAAKAGP